MMDGKTPFYYEVSHTESHGDASTETE